MKRRANQHVVVETQHGEPFTLVEDDIVTIRIVLNERVIATYGDRRVMFNENQLDKFSRIPERIDNDE